jgi:hypothetical protein
MPVIIDGSNNPTAGSVGYGDGSELAFTSAGSAGQILTSNGSGAPSWAAAPGTNGNVLTSNGTAWVSSAPAAGGTTMLFSPFSSPLI